MLPIIIKTFNRNYLIFKIDYTVEDRRPGEEHPDKYKHFINIRYLWCIYTWTIHTENAYEDLPYIK